MCTELTRLIEELSKYTSSKRPKCFNFIISYKKFVQSLIDINSLIGLKEAKYRVYLQVKSFIVNYRRHRTPMNSEKMNILLCGDSGCGKSKLGYYLAQLWGASGCIKHNDGKDIFEFPKEQNMMFSQKPLPQQPSQSSQTAQIAQHENEKSQLRQSLAIRENQILNYRTQIRKSDLLVKEILTSFNNVRKRITAKESTEEKLIQSKLQIIKLALKDLRSNEFDTPFLHQILPVSIPSLPGRPNTFETEQNFPFTLSSPPNSLILPTASLPTSSSTLLPFFLPQIQQTTVPNTIVELKEEEKEIKFIVVTKGDLVGKYQGHTEERVRKLLNKYIGGVIMIDEAYTLCTSASDDLGIVALAEIINFMSSHPGKIIFIFAGYREAMDNIFKMQAGLSRRIEFVIDIEKYTSAELADIFIQQLKEFDLKLSDTLIKSLYNFFKLNDGKFPQYGGSTEKFAKCVKQILYSDDDKFRDALNDDVTDIDFEKRFLELDMKIIEKGFNLYIQNSVDNVYDRMSDRTRDKMNLMYI